MSAAALAVQKLIDEGVSRLAPLHEKLEEFDVHIPVSDGWQSRTKIVRPKAELDAPCPLIVLFYGAGFLSGAPEMLLNSARVFAINFGAVVALPSYRLTPDARWPQPMEDGFDVVVHLSNNAEQDLGAKLANGFIVGGTSAGASIAAVCGGLFMHDHTETAKLGTPITGIFLSVPLLLVEEIVPAGLKSKFTSREDNRVVDETGRDPIDQIFEDLQCSDYTSLWFSPINGIVEGDPIHKPKVYLEHCQLDPFRDDARIYEALLRMKDVSTRIQLFPNDAHTAWTVIDYPRKGTKPSFENTWLAAMNWLVYY